MEEREKGIEWKDYLKRVEGEMRSKRVRERERDSYVETERQRVRVR